MFLFCFSFGTYSSLSSFCLTFIFCFCELGETATSHDLEGVALYWSFPYVDSLHLVALVGQLAWAWAWASGSPWGVLYPRAPWQGDRGWRGPCQWAVLEPRPPWWSMPPLLVKPFFFLTEMLFSSYQPFIALYISKSLVDFLLFLGDFPKLYM